MSIAAVANPYTPDSTKKIVSSRLPSKKLTMQKKVAIGSKIDALEMADDGLRLPKATYSPMLPPRMNANNGAY